MSIDTEPTRPAINWSDDIIPIDEMGFYIEVAASLPGYSVVQTMDPGDSYSTDEGKTFTVREEHIGVRIIGPGGQEDLSPFFNKLDSLRRRARVTQELSKNRETYLRDIASP